MTKEQRDDVIQHGLRIAALERDYTDEGTERFMLTVERLAKFAKRFNR